jgi:lysophospholipase L1-like esterase
MSPRKLIFILLTIFISVIFCLVIAEMVIRIDLAVSHKKRKIWVPEPYQGFVHARNNRFLWEDNRGKEFAVWQRTNHLGFMGDEVVLQKPEGVFRIVVLGDSFTEAMQIEEKLNFCNRLEDLLNQYRTAHGKRFEVLNAGVSGYSPVAQYLFYKRMLRDLNPDLVILQIWANDIFEDQKISAMSLLDENNLPVKINRYFTRKYSSLSADRAKHFQLNPIVYRLHGFFIEASRFYEYMYTLFVKLNKNSDYHKEMTAMPEYDDHNQFFMVLERNQLYNNQEFNRRARELTERYISALKNMVEEDGAKFMAFYIPFEGQLPLENHGGDTKLYTSYRAGFEMNHFLEEMNGRLGMNFLDLYPMFEIHRDEDLYIDWDGHLNEKGHELTARELFHYIVK